MLEEKVSALHTEIEQRLAVAEPDVEVLLAANLAFTVAFAINDDGFRWLYYLALVLNAQVIVSGAGPIAISSFRWVPAYLR